MATIKKLIRGDSYAIGRPLYTSTFLDADGEPYNLKGCTIRTTYKTEITSPFDDPGDTDAEIKHHIAIDTDGEVISQNGLFLKTTAEDGVIVEHFTSLETMGLPVGIEIISDIELTDAQGEVATWLFDEVIVVQDGVTNRTI